MDGVEQMLKSRGGYEKLQQSNPLLASLLAWYVSESLLFWVSWRYVDLNWHILLGMTSPVLQLLPVHEDLYSQAVILWPPQHL